MAKEDVYNMDIRPVAISNQSIRPNIRNGRYDHIWPALLLFSLYTLPHKLNKYYQFPVFSLQPS